MKFNNIRRRASPLKAISSKISKARNVQLTEFKPLPDLVNVVSCLDASANVKEWKPFHSLLIDTVKVKLRVKHPPLSELAKRSPNFEQDGYKFFIKCPQTGAVAQVFSHENGEVLLLEFSIPKFLTGQNIVGHLDVHAGCLEAIKKAFKLLDFSPTREEQRAISRGDYVLTRVDVTTHVDCETTDRVRAMMMALRTFIVSNAGDVSLYGLNAAYIGQHSCRRSLKGYPKGDELQKKGRGIPAHVYGSNYLTKVAKRLVRFELTLRGKELKRLGLSSPLAWNKHVAVDQLMPWIDKLKQANGVLPDIAGIQKLSPVMQNKLRLWLLKDVAAFRRDVSDDAYREGRKKVKAATGIDIELPPDVELQAASVTTIQQLFDRGLGFRTYEKKWPKLLAAVRAYQPAPAVTTSQAKSRTAHK